MENSLPEATARRLSHYYEYLKSQLILGKQRITSLEVSAELFIDPATVRKDLSMLGDVGRRGYGYDVAYLESYIAHLLGRNQPLQVVFIGNVSLFGALQESELLNSGEGYQILAIFETSQNPTEQLPLTLPVYPILKLREFVQEHVLDVAILAVSTDLAQHVAEQMVESGIKAILNCTMQVLRLPSHVLVKELDVLGELHWLGYQKGHMR